MNGGFMVIKSMHWTLMRIDKVIEGRIPTYLFYIYYLVISTGSNLKCLRPAAVFVCTVY